MGIHAAMLLPLGVLLLFSPIEANKKSLESDGKLSEKISTSLVLHNGVLKNRTEIHSSHPPEYSVVTVTSSRTSSSDPQVSTSVIHPIMMSNNSRENGTRELSLVSEDLVKLLPDEEELGDDESHEALPEALELRHARPGNRQRLYQRPRRPPILNRRNVFPAEPLRNSKRPNRKPTDGRREPTEKDCTFFSKTVCLKTLNYPQEAILRSIRSNKDMVMALLKDYNLQGEDRYEDGNTDDFLSENKFDNRFENNEIKRRSDYPLPYDNVEEGFTCPSQVMYARPQLARAASGLWKYIINTGEHTQTLRLEKCSKPKASCSFISENYRSSCTQVYNYHRLLTWDSNLGLHMDIFKIPSCCSCHVHGYTELYPPHSKDPPATGDEVFPGADFATQTDTDGLNERPTSYLTKYKPASTYESNFGSKPIVDAGSSNRPSFVLPGRQRPKKPSGSTSNSRPFDKLKLPTQHAPNTRAPGYKGPVHKGNRRPRPNRPYRRESTDSEDSSPSPSLNNWFNQPFDQESDASTKPHGDFDDDYQEPNRRVNYNYHPIIDFFKPEASMLQANEPLAAQSSPIDVSDDGNSWKPMISA